MFITSSRGSGHADPGAQNSYENFYDDAQIRECGSGCQNRYQIFMMTRGSRSADPGVRTVYKIFMMTRGSGSADPGVRHLSETRELNFYFRVHA
jgi:hypothetical protein